MSQLIQRSLLFLAGFAIVLALTAGGFPCPCEDDGNGQDCTHCQSCTLCKVRTQPTLVAAVKVGVDPPQLLRNSLPPACQLGELQATNFQSSPRAPPV